MIDPALDEALASYATRHPADAAKLRDTFRIAGGGGTPREAREASGLSIGQAAKLLGVTREWLERCERDRAVPSTAELEAMLRVYDVSSVKLDVRFVEALREGDR